MQAEQASADGKLKRKVTFYRPPTAAETDERESVLMIETTAESCFTSIGLDCVVRRHSL